MSAATKRVTAADVARLSGVSTATVSYVVNATPGQSIPEATRTRVLAAASELGYSPSPHARALARGRSSIVVLDLSELPHSEVLARFARAAAAEFDARGYLPIVDQPTEGSGDSHRRLLTLASALAPAIVITVTPLPEEVRDRLSGTGVGLFASIISGASTPAAHIDSAAHTQVGYLAERGHRVIGYCGSGEARLVPFDRIRRTAVQDAAASRGLRLVDLGSPRNPRDVTDAVAAARTRHPEMTAVAAYNDEVGLACLSSAHRLGLAVPDQLAIIGIDDDPLAALAYPALTTVTFAQPSVGDIRHYVDGVLDAAPVVEDPQPFVVVRESA
jgi:DNA-binding LacI/PurR family transcriptional regulator